MIAGVSNDLAATEPDVTLNLPIFDYQGGDKYMQEALQKLIKQSKWAWM
ncbi:MAG: hypothetical protein IPH45_07240 [Bacteroidales bacterium]|nr:hypothetical protein [Bacteroidales bacterium]